MQIKVSIILALAFCIYFLSACHTQSDAEEIITKAINAHGGEQYKHVKIAFDFRRKHYNVMLNQGQFIYERVFNDSIGTVHDQLSNNGLIRKVNNEEVNLSDEDESKYANSLNSVVYFALIPSSLNDPAVNKELIGQDTVKGEPYYEIRVTFDQQGGGKDYEDEFVYWIHQQKYTMDYLAYKFHTDGGGTRFREAYNTRGVNGIRFADYINYESTIKDFELEDYNELFEEGKVKEISRIQLENVEVENIPVEEVND